MNHMEPDDPRHGTSNGYSNLGCRCDYCRLAFRDEMRIQRARRKPLAPDDYRHGTNNGYTNYRCRCDRCLQARREQIRTSKGGST